MPGPKNATNWAPREAVRASVQSAASAQSHVERTEKEQKLTRSHHFE